MGQANDRGTPEERVQMAIEQQKIDKEKFEKEMAEKEANMTPEERAERHRARLTLASLLTFCDYPPSMFRK